MIVGKAGAVEKDDPRGRPPWCSIPEISILFPISIDVLVF
jgi:hypothetical protein